MARVVIPSALVLLAGIGIGWLNYHASDDVQLVAAALFLGGFGAALWRPRRAWVAVPLLWLAVPLSSIVGYANNFHPGLAKPTPLYETVVALIPAVIGAVLGGALGAAWRNRAAAPD